MISLAIRHARLATMEGAQGAPQDGPLALIEDGALLAAVEAAVGSLD